MPAGSAIIAIISFFEVLTILKKHGCTISAIDNRGYSAVDYAVIRQHDMDSFSEFYYQHPEAFY